MKSIFSVLSVFGFVFVTACSGAFDAPEAFDTERQASLRIDGKTGGAQAAVVRLKYAFRTGGAVSGMSYGATRIRVKVKNLGFQKTVRMHYAGHSRMWSDHDLRHLSHHGDYDVFGSDSAPETGEFCIKYLVNGETFWDNNNGANYRLAGSGSAIVGGHVVLDRAVASVIPVPSGPGSTMSMGRLQGEILVNNLAFCKAVFLHYQDSRSGEWRRVGAVYSGGSGGVEKWTFVVQSLVPLNSWNFVIGHEALDGSYSYWDNNFGMNYRCGSGDRALE